MRIGPPDDLTDGAFEWDEEGYHFDLLEASLAGESVSAAKNVWWALICALKRLRLGQWDAAQNLIDCIRDSDDDVIWGYSAALLGDAGTSAMIRRCVDECHTQFYDSTPTCQVEICNIFQQSRLLWTVPKLLDVYLSSTDRNTTGILSVYLSRLLEPEFGEVATAHSTDNEYRSTVLGLYDRIRSSLTSDSVPVLYGELFSVKSLAARLHSYLANPELDPTAVLRDRHYFEASTGIDCRSFYRNGELQPLAAAAIVEDFLESGEADKYEPGVRYFFGHRIPD